MSFFLQSYPCSYREYPWFNILKYHIHFQQKLYYISSNKSGEKECLKTILSIINKTTKEFKDIPSIDVTIANRYDQKLEDVQKWLKLTEWSQSNLDFDTVNNVQEQLLALKIIPKKIPFNQLVINI